MGVVYIGDRSVGKTHLALELAKPKHHCVKVISPDYDNLKALLYLEDGSGTRPTEADNPTYSRYLEVEVNLPTGVKQIEMDWIDTPGEIWKDNWQKAKPELWTSFLEAARASEGILLIVPPYRELLKPGPEADEYITQQQWSNRFKRWVTFFQQDCPTARHILICLNKADLFWETNLNQEAERLAYDPYHRYDWQRNHAYIANRYFSFVKSDLQQINQSIKGLAVRCFITSIYSRSLLELPWIYLGSFLADQEV